MIGRRVMVSATAGLVALAIIFQSARVIAGPEAAATQSAATQPAVAARAEDVRPLKAGDRAPTATLNHPDGEAVDLADLYAAGPSVLIFYRGGWCPYCSAHLGQIAEAEKELTGLGYQVLAISPDKPESLRETIGKRGFSYQLLSDSDMRLARAFGLAFRVDEPTVEQYRGFGIDLERASGRTHRLLPVPAVYIIDKTGVIRFAHWSPDYKKRLKGEHLLTAARRIAVPESAPKE